MQPEPTGWPEDFTSLIPTTTVTIAGVPVSVTNVDVDRTVSTDLPDDIRVIAGVSSASARVTVQTDTVWTPQEASDYLGREIRVYGGWYDSEVILFTGVVYSIDGQENVKSITLECDDNRYKAQSNVRLPMAAEYMPIDNVSLGVEPDPAWLSTVAVMDQLARYARVDSFPVTWIPEGIGGAIHRPIFRLPGQGSGVAEVGTLDYNFMDSRPDFVTMPGGWGLSVPTGWHTNGIWNVEDYGGSGTSSWNLRVNDYYRITAAPSRATGEVVVEMTSSGGGTVEEYFRIFRNATDVLAQRRDINAGTWVTDASLPVVDGEFILVSATWQKTSTGSAWRCDIIDHNGNTDSRASAAVPMGLLHHATRVESRYSTMVEVSTSAFAGLAPDPDQPPLWEGEWRPGFAVYIDDPADIVPLKAMPSYLVNQKNDAWSEMRRIALDEAGLLLVNEEGTIVYRPRSWIDNTPVSAMLDADENLVNRGWTLSLDQARYRAEVGYYDIEIRNNRFLDTNTPWILAGKASEEILMQNNQGSGETFIQLDGDAIGVDLSLTPSDTTSVDSPGSIYWAAYQNAVDFDGSNANDETASGNVDVADLNQLATDTVKATFQMGTSGFPNTATLSGRRGAPNSPFIACKILAIWGNEQTATATDSIDPLRLSKVIEIPGSRFRQYESVANDYGNWILAHTEAFFPEQKLRIIPNLLIQLGDIVQVRDPANELLVITGGVVANSIGISSGSLIQSITIRPISVVTEPDATTINDFNAVHYGDTFDDFNAAWSGATFDDFNEAPTSGGN